MKKAKRPTPERLTFYRSKIEDGSYIGKNQLAEVFAEIDHLKEQNSKMQDALEHAIKTIPAGEDWSLEHLGSYLEQVVAEVKGE
ncbi:MAG: hypothetical protein AB7E51_00405 [Pseudodesulfovibrio sp.]|uniref:hypothetical protein n=1 Tax=Pseudodesulfovibrio sp. TaxID=2035812 RepID=UPI003D10CF4B